ncbi:hypothetical protein BDD14_1180 [Edaphobacter modestus]|uniref:Uncharacterized protein n=1 Tax=Edaphobacter modestus TaxID=388466 RepID=A0A4Q7YQ18_9BACT|nr:hypothetical protein BDD14_1180 [Edaphobacter modestus]
MRDWWKGSNKPGASCALQKVPQAMTNSEKIGYKK